MWELFFLKGIETLCQDWSDGQAWRGRGEKGTGDRLHLRNAYIMSEAFGVVLGPNYGEQCLLINFCFCFKHLLFYKSHITVGYELQKEYP